MFKRRKLHAAQVYEFTMISQCMHVQLEIFDYRIDRMKEENKESTENFIAAEASRRILAYWSKAVDRALKGEPIYEAKE